MNGIMVDKQLCMVGDKFDRDLDHWLEQMRINKTPQNSQEVHKLLKLYFVHRQTCTDCQVIIRVAGRSDWAEGDFEPLPEKVHPAGERSDI